MGLGPFAVRGRMPACGSLFAVIPYGIGPCRKASLGRLFLLQSCTRRDAEGCIVAPWEKGKEKFLQICRMLCRRYGFCLSFMEDFF